ncbi:MAG: hypothetical protein O2958_07910 [Gemmatimonadetes bacterium]|nr:hypothetical protein [Gemmatimonadota bacterium]MDA1104082.1 hypothetical protein [Gemmatimonadota bacterium]
MTRPSPPFPEGQPKRFRSTVHGIVFAGRDRYVDGLAAGDPLRLVPDPPVQEAPEVWVHLESGEPIGHLPPDIAHWLWPWLAHGGIARARLLKVRGAEVPSWRRVLLEVSCGVQ